MWVNNMKKYFFAFVYFLLAIIVFIFARIDQETLDISIHDTYLVIQYEHIWMLLSVYFFVLSAITFGLKFLKVSLSKVWLHLHSWFSLILFFASYFTLNSIEKSSQPKRYYDYSVYEDFKNSYNPIDFNEILTVLLILFVFVQSFFIISILVGYFQQRKHGQSTKRNTKHVE
jgi:heme/copper-type cytochrome/quinol oxidase subunit 1